MRMSAPTRRKVLGVLAAAPVFAACSSVAARISSDRGGYGDLFAQLERIVRDMGVPSINAAIVRDGQVRFSAAVGYADVDQRREIGTATVQNFGSTTKMVTMTAALQLVERGQLSLDDPIDALLAFRVRNPAFPDVPITLGQLIDHRSSVADDDSYDLGYQCGSSTISLEDWLRTYFDVASDERFKDWEPGTHRAYSNVGYGLIGLLIEKASDLSFDEYCRTNIFAPLGMTRSHFAPDATAYDYAVPYTVTPDWFDADRHFRGRFARLSRFNPSERPIVVGDARPFCIYSTPTPPDGGLRTNAGEFAKFIAAWANNGTDLASDTFLLRTDTVEKVVTPSDDNGFSGLMMQRAYFGDSGRLLPGGPLVGHQGADPGVGSFAGFRPNSGDGLVFAFNSWFMDEIGNALLDVMLPYID